MESKDLNTLEFNAFVGSLITYEIILKTRDGIAKPRERNISLEASSNQNEESSMELDPSKDDDEEMALYGRDLRKFKGLFQSRRKELI